MSALTIEVVGTPAPQGSKRHVGNGIMVESSKKVKPWRIDVKTAALTATDGSPFLPIYNHGVRVEIDFYLPRPKSHYRTGANAHLLRENAPQEPATRPDLDKLIRSTLDGLGESGVWRDDSQVVRLLTAKRFADGRRVGADITVSPMGDRA